LPGRAVPPAARRHPRPARAVTRVRRDRERERHRRREGREVGERRRALHLDRRPVDPHVEPPVTEADAGRERRQRRASERRRRPHVHGGRRDAGRDRQAQLRVDTAFAADVLGGDDSGDSQVDFPKPNMT
jgi:hypothetical protein